ncbi:MAG: pirin family protein [Jatrophihabitans sp.]|uniref:pirin family protein n=1 Tax=Jatrophihabitans sp. TaxID=1932789 RepID=UPI003F7D3D85
MRVVRAADRYRVEHDGITSWHCFSAGAHYDPDNTAFGRVIAVDEHLVAPGAGFDWHAHAAGVRIISWVLEGLLRHEDDDGAALEIGPGEVLVQVTGDGLRHRETNAAPQPLRFVQTAVLDDGPQHLWSGEPDASGLVVVRDRATVRGHCFVARGSFVVDGTTLREGDSARLREAAQADGAGELLVVAAE